VEEDGFSSCYLLVGLFRSRLDLRVVVRGVRNVWSEKREDSDDRDACGAE